ncbi:MAG: hypothetical protein ABI629_10550 [bacterium]
MPRLLASGALLAVLSVTVSPCAAADAAAAMRLYRDPITGAPAIPPTDVQPPMVAAERAVAADAAPVEEPVDGPAGGVRISFDRRLRAAVTRQAGTGGLHECVQAGGPAQ